MNVRRLSFLGILIVLVGALFAMYSTKPFSVSQTNSTETAENDVPELVNPFKENDMPELVDPLKENGRSSYRINDNLITFQHRSDWIIENDGESGLLIRLPSDGNMEPSYIHLYEDLFSSVDPYVAIEESSYGVLSAKESCKTITLDGRAAYNCFAAKSESGARAYIVPLTAQAALIIYDAVLTEDSETLIRSITIN